MTGEIIIRDLADHEHAWAAACYEAIQFAVSPPGTLALVAELDGARVGLGRLVAYGPDVVELGGIWTADAARGRGVARAIVMALLSRRDGFGAAPGGASGGTWCIPFAHLAAFYTSCGFQQSPPPWPAPIAAKVAECIAHGLPEVAVLAR